jgi:hypothetical protein
MEAEPRPLAARTFVRQSSGLGNLDLNVTEQWMSIGSAIAMHCSCSRAGAKGGTRYPTKSVIMTVQSPFAGESKLEMKISCLDTVRGPEAHCVLLGACRYLRYGTRFSSCYNYLR